MTEEMEQDLRAMQVESSTVALLNKSEIDQQIATARKYPRSIKRFRDETLQMVTLSETIAQECIYALPRDNKVIEGPSARFAEVVACAWGNSRAGARVVSDQGDFVTAQGVFHDLERNVAITYEVQRRIVDKYGKRYKPDMIGVTANAACSVALRNAILKGIPKAFWSDMYTAARKTAAGDMKSLSNKRADAIKAFQIYGVSEQQILALLNRPGVQDIGLEDLVILHGVLTAIKEGDTTPEQAFGEASNGAAKFDQPVYFTNDEFAEKKASWKDLVESGKKSNADLITFAESKGKRLTEAQKAEVNAWKKKTELDEEFVRDMSRGEKGGDQ